MHNTCFHVLNMNCSHESAFTIILYNAWFVRGRRCQCRIYVTNVFSLVSFNSVIRFSYIFTCLIRLELREEVNYASRWHNKYSWKKFIFFFDHILILFPLLKLLLLLWILLWWIFIQNKNLNTYFHVQWIVSISF